MCWSVSAHYGRKELLAELTDPYHEYSGRGMPALELLQGEVGESGGGPGG